MVSFHVGKEDVGLASLQVIEKGLLVSLSVLNLVFDMSFGLLQPLLLLSGETRLSLETTFRYYLLLSQHLKIRDAVCKSLQKRIFLVMKPSQFVREGVRSALVVWTAQSGPKDQVMLG